MDKSQDSNEGEGPEVAAITAALKFTALVQLTRGIQTRDQVIDDMIATNVSDDRAELETIVGEALACLADTVRFQSLFEPVEGFEYEHQREAAINSVGAFHQEVVTILESDGDAEEKLARAHAMVQQRLGVSQELAEKIVQESLVLGLTVTLDRSSPPPAPVGPGPVQRFLGGLWNVFEWFHSGWGVPRLVRTAIDHAFEIIRDSESLVPFLMLRGHPTVGIAMLGGESHEDALAAACTLLDRERGKFSEYVFVTVKQENIGDQKADLIVAIFGEAGSVRARRFAQPYLPSSAGHPPRKAGRPIQFGDSPSLTTLLNEGD
jgi:hypothetical protein